MRLLVIVAHPVESSFVAALSKAVVSALKRGGHEVDLCDLYAEGFDPVMSRAERVGYHDAPSNRQGVEDHVRRLQQADGVIFVFPAWWYGMPAILKGYFDRVWLPGVAFELGAAAIVPRLDNLKLIGVVTTMGAPAWFTRLYMGNPVRKVLVRGLGRLLPRRGVERFWLAMYDMDRSTAGQRARFLGKVERRVGRLRR